MNNLELERLLNENLAQTELTITRLTVWQSRRQIGDQRSLRVSPQAKPLIDYAGSQQADAVLVHHGYFGKVKTPVFAA